MEACWKTILKSLFISWRFPQMHVLGLASCSAWHLIRKHPSFHFHTYLTACKPSQQSENQFWYYNGKKQRGLLTNFKCTWSKMCENNRLICLWFLMPTFWKLKFTWSRHKTWLNALLIQKSGHFCNIYIV